MAIKTPLLEYVWNRYKKATSKKEAVVELRITYERKQKYMTTGIFLLPKHWHHGTIVNLPPKEPHSPLISKKGNPRFPFCLPRMSPLEKVAFSVKLNLRNINGRATDFLKWIQL